MLAFFCNHCNIMQKSNSNINHQKNISSENFPVGSWLLPTALKLHVINFYNFARAADNIADSNVFVMNVKYKKLKQFVEGIKQLNFRGTPPKEVVEMVRTLEETKVSKQYCLDLLQAFKQDVSKNRYNDWLELLNYCKLSAAPVGRYLIDLHGGFKNGDKKYFKNSDALCNALQILNHLQDCQEDFLYLNRVYLPLDMLKNYNVPLDHLTANKASLELRECLDEILNKVDILILESSEFPSKLNSRRLSMESYIIINIAAKLSKKLRKLDPIAAKIRLSKFTYFQCFVLGIFKAISIC